MPTPTVEVKSVNLAICISPMLIYVKVKGSLSQSTGIRSLPNRICAAIGVR